MRITRGGTTLPFRPKRSGILPLVGFLIFLGACGRGPEPTAPELDEPSLQPTRVLPPKLAFMSRRDGNGEIYVMNGNGAVQVNLTNNPTLDFLPSWSPDGKKIAFLRSVHVPDPDEPGQLTSSDDLLVMNPDGTGVADLSGSSLGMVLTQRVAWSPDGSTIAFSAVAAGHSLSSGLIDIWLVHPDGSGLVPLTTDHLGNIEVAWSPDGSKLAFVRHHSNGGSRGAPEDRGIYVIAANGTGLTQLTASRRDFQPTWSPSGDRIAFEHLMRNGNNDIFTVNANGAARTNLTNHPANDAWPSWSPDGASIAFSSDRTGRFQIFRIRSNGTALKQLTTAEDNFEPLWSPDGSYIAFTRRPSDSNDHDIWRMTASGSGQVQLTTAGDNVDPSWEGSK